METWKKVEGFPYEVSDHGNVRRIGKARILSAYRPSNKYGRVNLSKDGKVYPFRVHRLMAFAFLGLRPKSGMVVNHLDGNKMNNHLSNLEVTTNSENIQHAWATGLMAKEVLNG